jgi:HEPN domain-containing protein
MANKMNQEEKYAYWLDIAKYDLQTAEAMFSTGRWVYVVFMCQQSIEKLLKGLYGYYKDDEIPRIHSLSKIIGKFADKLPTTIDNRYYALFDRLTAHYIQGRYPEYIEEISQSIHEDEAKQLLDESKGAFSWLLTLKP